MILNLPYPVSANDFMGSFIPKGGTRPIPFVTPEAKRFKKECGWIAKAAGMSGPTTRPIEIASVILHPRSIGPAGKKTGATMDLDNVLKVSLDSLKGVVYVDDRQIQRIRNVEYGDRTEHGALIIEIIEFVPKAAPIFAEEARA